MNKYARNHRPAKMYPFLNGTATMAEIAKIAGVTVSCVCRRIKAGTPLDRPSWSPWSKRSKNEDTRVDHWSERGES